MKNPKVSVIVPVYNTEKYLRRCIESILTQSLPDIELLLIDDGSKDHSGAICDEYAARDSRVRVFHTDNGGVSQARNLGLDEAKGEYIAFSDSDDWIDQEMLKELYDKLKQEDADVAYCDISMVFKDHTTIYKAAKFSQDKTTFLNNYIASKWTSLCNLIVKRSLFEEHSIRLPKDVAFAEDYHASVKLMYYAKKVCHVQKPFYCYNRINETSALHTFSPKHYDKERWVNLNLIEFFEKEGIYEDCAETLSWRLLKSIQEYVLDNRTYDKFTSTHPDSQRFIWSCPYLNFKIKIMMWSLSHNLRFVARSFLLARKIKGTLLGKKS